MSEGVAAGGVCDEGRHGNRLRAQRARARASRRLAPRASLGTVCKLLGGHRGTSTYRSLGGDTERGSYLGGRVATGRLRHVHQASSWRGQPLVGATGPHSKGVIVRRTSRLRSHRARIWTSIGATSGFCCNGAEIGCPVQVRLAWDKIPLHHIETRRWRRSSSESELCCAGLGRMFGRSYSFVLGRCPYRAGHRHAPNTAKAQTNSLNYFKFTKNGGAEGIQGIGGF